jgi:hypothetical protein
LKGIALSFDEIVAGTVTVEQIAARERTDPFRSAVPIDPDQLFRLIPISRSD